MEAEYGKGYTEAEIRQVEREATPTLEKEIAGEKAGIRAESKPAPEVKPTL